jgi:L-iditol 2-dehydrogenase
LSGDTVLVAGQGPIGLMFTRLLALRGMKVLATDLLPARLELAREFGAVRVHCPSSEPQNPNPESRQKAELRKPKSSTTLHASRLPPPPLDPQLSTLIHQLTRSRGLDAAVIAVPSDAVVHEAQSLVRGAGQVLLFSHTRRGAETSVDLATVCMDEKDLIGSYSSDFLLQKEVARLVFSRKLDARRLITHQFPLAQTAAAIELASHPTAESLKVVVVQGSGQ